MKFLQKILPLSVAAFLVFAVSANAATNWTQKRLGDIFDITIYFKVQAFDRDHLMMVGNGFSGLFTFDQQLIFRSDDGGQSVEDTYTVNIFPGTPDWLCNSFLHTFDLHFDSYDVGRVYGAWNNGDTNCFLTQEVNWVVETQNAGDSWQNVGLSPVYDDTQFNAVDVDPVSDVGFAVGSTLNIWRSTDGGQTWAIRSNAPSVWGSDHPLVDVDVVNQNLIFMTGEVYLDEPDDTWDDPEEDEDFWGDVDGFKGELFRSTDGGLTWESLLSDPDIGFQAVQFTSTTRGVLVAVNEDIDETHIYYTTDGGDTWDEGALPPVSGVGNPGTGYVITAVQMMDTNEGWAVGGDPSDTDAVILHTTNGGVSWSADEYRGGGRFLDIHMINERFGYAVGSRSLIAEYYVPGISAPVADAGPDQTVLVNTVVALDGSGSYDPDGDPLTYKWSHSSGPANPPLIVPTNVAPTFTPTVTGDYVIQLVVTDFDTSSAPDTVKITVVDELDDDDADDDVDDDLDDDDDFGPPGDDDNDDANDDADETDCRDLLSMIFDTCDAYFEDYPDRFDAEQACDESEDPWACAVECRAQYDTCDQLFQCLDEECDFPASKHKSAPDDEEGDISGGCEFCGG